MRDKMEYQIRSVRPEELDQLFYMLVELVKEED